MIDTILNAYFGKQYEFEDFSALPFVCDVTDDYICRMESCPLSEPCSAACNTCDSCCIHFLEHPDE